MDNKNHLSKIELDTYTTIKDIPIIFTTKEIQDAYPEINKNKINKILKNLKNKKYIIHIERGKYLINKSYTNQELQEIAIKLYFGYIAYSTALYDYNLIDYFPQTIFIATNNKSKEIKINNATLKYVHIKNFNNYKIDNKILISTLEKTIFDCFNKIEYAGGYSVISKAIYESYKRINWNQFIELNKTLASKRQKQITGYILNLITSRTKIILPENVIVFFKKQDKSKTYLLNIKNKKSKYISEWKIKDNLGENNILNWWY